MKYHTKIFWDTAYKNGNEYRIINDIFLSDLLKKIRKITGHQPKTMVDFGCGSGDALIKFSKRGINSKGYDFSKNAVNKAKKNLRKNNISEKIVQVADIETLNTDKTFDVVLLKLTYAFIQNKEEFLKKIKEFMKPNGVFILITPVLYKEIKYKKEDKPQIAVSFNTTMTLLNKLFLKTIIFHHDYFGEKGDSVTFLIKR